ncbi:RNA 2',3'-cyclic phosphodiesterase [Pseudomonas sp. DTU_2021_1001937_2_SI_NGA_ILE_001]|uniref:RNA 2',3'-cyclic phosphodiesterase n=1 Tax=Pseudomonas sp. DTU_2021_1001937_2_SI_NGA_ILE_001 TaxID=3077589 RepID=UPI0028FC30E5|nr:RNA 2',3'-cyclic phosphodiesterase [Pseudomonas sp. DTU_2021_1001937_2_SI_NGA_ILE_001]WNW10559.1 RNA 2',3'-cyclic phosphodiesterase [Pseudomonas sp. DTU_2021_1001937_2_SI_NGA_ILE_001]
MNSHDLLPHEPFKRLFFALPCSAVQGKAISRWRSALKLRNGRPVPTANFHLTLMFLGDVGVSQLPAILDAAARLRPLPAPSAIILDQLEVWRRSQALVLVPEQPQAALLRWVYELQQAMLPLGFAVDPREFQPHLTLMRDYRGPVPEAPLDTEFRIAAREFVLYESYKGKYEPLAQWPLVEPAPAPLERPRPMLHPFQVP